MVTVDAVRDAQTVVACDPDGAPAEDREDRGLDELSRRVAAVERECRAEGVARDPHGRDAVLARQRRDDREHRGMDVKVEVRVEVARRVARRETALDLGSQLSAQLIAADT